MRWCGNCGECLNWIWCNVLGLDDNFCLARFDLDRCTWPFKWISSSLTISVGSGTCLVTADAVQTVINLDRHIVREMNSAWTRFFIFAVIDLRRWAPTSLSAETSLQQINGDGSLACPSMITNSQLRTSNRDVSIHRSQYAAMKCRQGRHLPTYRAWYGWLLRA